MLRGSHQLLPPSRCMTAGTSSIWMMVALLPPITDQSFRWR
jgi:hypothetical protein